MRCTLYTALLATALALPAAAQAQSTTMAAPTSITTTGSVQGSTAVSKAQYVQIQQNLKAAGYFKGSTNGTWGPQSRAALRKYQQANGLTVNGQLSGPTLSALGVGANANTNASTGTASANTATEGSTQMGTGGTTSGGLNSTTPSAGTVTSGNSMIDNSVSGSTAHGTGGGSYGGTVGGSAGSSIGGGVTGAVGAPGGTVGVGASGSVGIGGGAGGRH